MSERKPIPASCLALLLAVAAPAAAMVEGGPHDLLGQGYVERGRGEAPVQCVECHLPTFNGDQFSMEKPPPSVAYYGRAGLLCYSCHDGTTIVNQNVDASNSAFHPNAHTLLMGSMPLPRFESGQAELPVTQERLECTTCHTPHDSAIRPFQRTGLQLLCTLCHTGRENKGYGALNVSGGHPVHETIEDDAGAKTPIEVQTPFRQAFSAAYPAAGGKTVAEVHWKRGGHLSQGGEGTIECHTCHAVHGGEGYAPREGLLTMNPVRETADEFCEACHRGARGDELQSPHFPNPGGTTTGRTYHPCDDDRSNGTATPTGIRAKIAFPLGSAGPNQILCTTCHTPHGGISGTPALREPVASSRFCEECHVRDQISPFHHPLDSPQGSDHRCLAPPANFMTVPGEEGLTCYICHVGHNAGLGRREKDFIPILRFSVLEDTYCLQCHGEDNVTCVEPNRGKASHFLGDPTLSTTYEDKAPPLRETLWPLTQLYSRYGGEQGKTVICLSCHAFTSVTGPGAGPPLEHHVLANAGNDFEWAEDLGVYLCTGCHGARPGTHGNGNSHPMMAADINKLGTTPLPPATYTPNGRINCDSCHVPHGAVIGAGYYILETIKSENEDPKAIHPKIDFTPICYLCHTTEKY